MKLYDCSNYKVFVTSRIRMMPRNGRGQFQKLAQHLRVSTTLISQIFRGDKHLTLDQACLAGEFLGLMDWELEYFVNLVEKDRAGSQKLRRIIERRLEETREKVARIGNRLPQTKKLSESDQAIFYSQWYYSAIRLITSVEGFDNVEAISEHFQLPRTTVTRVLEFLTATGLCVEEKGKFKIGPRRTHLPPDAPLALRHHLNWRTKGLERLNHLRPSDLAFTAPMCIGRGDAKAVLSRLQNFLEEITDTIDSSANEQLYCLNMDWMEIS